MPRTFCSQYVRLSDIPESHLLIEDWQLYNRLLKETLALNASSVTTKAERKALRKQQEENGVPKSRPGGGKRKEGVQTTHTLLKDKYHVTDYFVTSVENDAGGILRSGVECLDRRINLYNVRIDQMTVKAAGIERRLCQLQTVKSSLKERSSARKNGQPVPAFHGYQGHPFRVTDVSQQRAYVRIVPFNRMKDANYIAPYYDNEYLFELNYLDPLIKRLKVRRKMILNRQRSLQCKIDALKRRKNSKKPCYSLVSAKRSKGWNHLAQKERNALMHKHRQRPMLLAGRADAPQGNFMVRYNPVTEELTYRTADGKNYVTIPHVHFGYGGEVIAKAVTAPKATRKSVGWVLRITGNHLQVKCVVNEVPNTQKNSCLDTGVVAIDKNYDNISMSELDGNGNLLHREIIHFDPGLMSSKQYDLAVSEALEKVFKKCVETQKPLACEKISDIPAPPMYGNQKRNRHISMFAYRKMDQLIDSKSNKYSVDVYKVNPAYTSKIGRYKYMNAYNITVHEAASYVIGRRAMGFKDKIPKKYRPLLTEKQLRSPSLSQWKALSAKLTAERGA